MPISSPKVCPVLIGRDDEMAELRRLCQRASLGRFSFAVVSGEAGAGKTRLQEEISQFALEAGFQRLIGGCTERDRDFPFGPFVDALRQRLREQRVSPRTFLGQQSVVLAELLPELGSLEPDAHAPSQLSPEQSKRRLFESLVALFDELASRQPLLLVLEDLHWADATSLELLHLLPRRLASAQILILCTARSEERGEEFTHCLDRLRRQRVISEILLEPLAAGQVGDMLSAMLPVPPPRSVVATIQQKTNGNPFFIEELVTSIGSSGAASVTPEELEIPETVRETIWMRLRGLDPVSRRVANIGAVIGQEFGIELLASACDLSEEELAAAIDELESRHILVSRRAARQSRLAFRHALTRDVIHERIPQSQRRLLHRQIGDVLEEIRRQSRAVPVSTGDLGYHFHESAQWEKALEYASASASAAAQVHATAEALIHYRRALDAATALGHPAVAELRLRCGQALALLGAFDEAQRQLEEALAIARSQGDQMQETEALYSLAGLYASRDYARALELAEQSVVLARQLHDQRREALALNRLGNVLTNTVRFDESRRMHEEALKIFESLGEDWGSADSLDLVAMNRYLAGDVTQSRALCQRAAGIFQRLDDPERVASSVTSRGLYLAMIDGPCGTDAPPSAFRDDAELGLQICREIGWRSGEAYALVALACADIGLGHYGSARSLAESALTIAVDIDHQQWRVIALLTLGLLRTQLLDHAGAFDIFSEALEVARAIGSTQFEERLVAWSARCRFKLGDTDSARSGLAPLLPESVAGSTIGRRRALATLTEMELASGDVPEALRRLAQLMESAGQHLAPEIVLLQGDAAAAAGNVQSADAAYATANQLAIQYGPRGLLWRASTRRIDLWRGIDQRIVDQESELLQAELELLTSSLNDERERERFLAAAGARVTAQRHARHRTTRTVDPGGLTPRERDVAALVATGLSNKEIAYRLSIAEKTVEMHVSNCLGKLEFSSRTQLAGWALSQNLTFAPGGTG